MSDVSPTEPKEPVSQHSPEDLVSKKVVEEYKNDMFKYKSQLKEREAELQRIKDEQALREKRQLEEQAEWKTLYEREKAEREKTSKELQEKSQFFVNTSKINAVVQKLGGFKKDSYVKFVDTSRIDLREDGTFDADSINREVDRIKQEYPELLLAGPTTSKMPANAPANLSTGPNTNELSKLSTAELTKLAIQKTLKG